MPYFDYDGDIDVSVDDFLSACDSRDIKELIEALVEDEYLPESVLKTQSSNNPVCISESEFDDALNKLKGKWNVLSREEEEIIINISKRF